MPLSFLGFGSPVVDYNAVVTEDFLCRHLSGEKGGTVHISTREREILRSALPSGVKRSCGGSAGNTVYALLKLGISAALFGKLAPDEDGKYFLREMETSGGDTRFLLRAPAGNTGCCLCFVTQDAERTMRSDLGVSGEIFKEDVKPELFDGAPHVHTEGYMMELPAFLPFLKEAKNAGCRISLDLSSKELAAERRRELPDLLKEYVSCLFLNQEEAAAFTGSSDAEKAMEKLEGLCPCVNLKLGPAGVLLKTSDGQKRIIPGLQVPVADTTAAGDYYAAGFFHGILRGKSEWDAAKDGVFLASQIVQFAGSRLPESRWEMIRKQLQSRRNG